jgi:pimeloyl-ACP methyl ester carboxylesterase
MPRTAPDQAPAKYREWLDELHRGSEFAIYDTFAQFEKVLARRNPRTAAEHIAFIARSWAAANQEGRIELRADPRHKRSNPVLYQRDQAEACWKEITAPLLYVVGEESASARHLESEITAEKLQSIFRDVSRVSIPGAGHMLHHEQPVAVAELIEQFFR